MLNKKDPLIGAVQDVMQRNHIEREVTRVVNEAFGIEDRKALPHEYQAEWDSVYQQVITEAVEGSIPKTSRERDLASKHGHKGRITKGDVLKARGVLEEDELEEEKMTDAEIKKREEIVMSMKKKMSDFKSRYGKRAKDVMYATATKQAMTEQQTPMPISGEKNSSWFNRKTDMQTATSNLSKVARLRRMKAAGTPLDTKRDPKADSRTDKTSDFGKAADAMVVPFASAKQKFDAGDKKGAAIDAGIDAATIGLAGAALRGTKKAYDFIKTNKKVDRTTDAASNLSAGAARRPTNQSVPSVTSSAGSATGRFSAGGPFGNIRDASKVQRRGGDARASGSGPSGTMTSTARLSAVRRSSPGNAPAASASSQSATSSASIAQAVSRGRQLAQSGRQAQAAAGQRPSTMSGTGSLRPQSRPAAGLQTAKPNMYQGAQTGSLSDIQQAQAATPKVGVTARKIEAPGREVSAKEIMTSKQYQQGVKDVGGEAAARKIQPGRNVAGVGPIEKGETIYGNVKKQLSKTAVPGFEAGNTKGGAGR